RRRSGGGACELLTVSQVAVLPARRSDPASAWSVSAENDWGDHGVDRAGPGFASKCLAAATVWLTSVSSSLICWPCSRKKAARAEVCSFSNSVSVACPHRTNTEPQCRSAASEAG